jgi:hypothetical protein
MSTAGLPAAFRDLEPYLDWALPTERERVAKRVATPMAAIVAFHAALSRRMEAIIEYLDQYAYAELPADARRLADLALALVEVCNLVEMYKDPARLNMMDWQRFVPYE